MKKIPLIMLVSCGILIFTGCGKQVAQVNVNQDIKNDNTNVDTVASDEIDTGNWQIIKNEKMGIAFKYPQINGVITEFNDDYSNLITDSVGQLYGWQTTVKDVNEMDYTFTLAGGGSTDFTTGRSSWPGDVYQVNEKAGRYYLQISTVEKEIEVIKAYTTAYDTLAIIYNIEEFNPEGSNLKQNENEIVYAATVNFPLAYSDVFNSINFTFIGNDSLMTVEQVINSITFANKETVNSWRSYIDYVNEFGFSYPADWTALSNDTNTTFIRLSNNDVFGQLKYETSDQFTDMTDKQILSTASNKELMPLISEEYLTINSLSAYKSIRQFKKGELLHLNSATSTELVSETTTELEYRYVQDDKLYYLTFVTVGDINDGIFAKAEAIANSFFYISKNTSDWLVYSNKEYGYNVNYPADWVAFNKLDFDNGGALTFDQSDTSFIRFTSKQFDPAPETAFKDISIQVIDESLYNPDDYLENENQITVHNNDYYYIFNASWSGPYEKQIMNNMIETLQFSS